MTKVFKYVLWTTLWFCPLVAHAQSTTIEDTDFPRYYRSPLEIPINLSGNFGEFRSNHFHAGYDMRIGGVVGAKLFAIAEGFVSRISVSPGGYGNGIYIEHPNGTTSVYGHLLDFASHIQEYVKEQQYERQSFSVDLPLSPDQFPVKKGDFIGRAGNSGASNGPHLHLEIRNTENQSLLYLSGYGLYPVPDRTPPQLTRLQFWGYSQQGAVPRTSLLRAVDLSARPSVIPVTDTFYVAMGAFDRIEGSPAYLSLAQYDVYIDDNKVYTYKKDNLPSSMGRYLNSYLQYDQRVNHDRTLLKTWLEPGNMLTNLVSTSQNGLFTLADTLEHRLKIVLTDDSGNESVYRYQVARKSVMPDYPVKGRVMLWAMDNYHEEDGLQLYLPFGALGKNIDFDVARVAVPDSLQSRFFAPLWRIGSPLEPLLRPMRLSICAQVPEEFKEKALIVSVSSGGRISSAGGKWNNDYLEANTFNFGSYTVAIDTIPPVITPRFQDGADLRKASQLSFTIHDDLSGINSYEGTIDGSWALFVYDAKNRRLSYTFDRKRITSGKRHTLELKVTDHCNNVSIYKTDFLW